MQWKVPSTCGVETEWPLHFQNLLIGTKFCSLCQMHGQMDSFPSSMLKQPPSQNALYLHISICLTTTTSLAVSLIISWAFAWALLLSRDRFIVKGITRWVASIDYKFC